ncbi:MAG: tRNA pseudouridine(55) synthase TruB, partial [Candidatus Pacebacteria bacterium]|nr:tRNA pseudouridine(55) synthase TruB [Candidatus Paceibacterota bacterium]
MSRQKNGDRITGWVILDKPLGISSNAAIMQVRRLLNANRVGHAGTLDPMATGVLPIALGEATKLISYLVADQKTYRFTVKFGEARSTDDAEGEVIASSPLRPSRADLLQLLPQFRGLILQRPPIFSAIQQGGVRAYDAARQGKPLDLPPRQVQIDRLEIIEFDDSNREFAILEMDCGPGTFVRSLARDLGDKLGSFAYVAKLHRSRVGKITDSIAISLDKLAELRHSNGAINSVLPLLTLLDDIPALPVTAAEARLIGLGQAIAFSLPPYRIEVSSTSLESQG